MELDELSQSGIRRIADYSPYLDQLAGLAQQMGLRQRSNLMHVETALRNHWSLGQNSILSRLIKAFSFLSFPITRLPNIHRRPMATCRHAFPRDS
jgi:hypothetical protein